MINMDTVEVDLLRAMNSHWKTNSDENLFFEGQQRTTNVLQRYIEVKYFGPFYEDEPDSTGLTTVIVQVHLDCNVTGNDIYELNRLTGKMTAIARLQIFVPEFEDCLELLGIRVLPKGQVTLKTNQKASIVEADYRIQINTKGV
jgi:hypothetical protein